MTHSHSTTQWGMCVVHLDSTFTAYGSHSWLTLTKVGPYIPNPFMGYLILIELLCSYKHPLSLWVNNLIHFYGCCKKIVDARKVSDEMPKRFVEWSSVDWLRLLWILFEEVKVFSLLKFCIAFLENIDEYQIITYRHSKSGGLYHWTIVNVYKTKSIIAINYFILSLIVRLPRFCSIRPFLIL